MTMNSLDVVYKMTKTNNIIPICDTVLKQYCKKHKVNPNDFTYIGGYPSKAKVKSITKAHHEKGLMVYSIHFDSITYLYTSLVKIHE